MRIRYQKVVDAHGAPTAALVPWDEFQRIQALLDEEEPIEISSEWRDELHKRAREIDEGKVELIDGDEVLKQLRDLVD